MGLNIITSLSFTFVVASQLIHTRTHSLYPFLSLSLSLSLTHTHTHKHKHTLSPTIFHSLIFYKSLLFSTIIPALYPSKKLQVMKTSDRPWSKIISLSLSLHGTFMRLSFIICLKAQFLGQERVRVSCRHHPLRTLPLRCGLRSTRNVGSWV